MAHFRIEITIAAFITRVPFYPENQLSISFTISSKVAPLPNTLLPTAIAGALGRFSVPGSCAGYITSTSTCCGYFSLTSPKVGPSEHQVNYCPILHCKWPAQNRSAILLPPLLPAQTLPKVPEMISHILLIILSLC